VEEKIENGFLECYMCCIVVECVSGINRRHSSPQQEHSSAAWLRPQLWARERAIEQEQDKLLKDGSDEILSLEGIGSSGFVDVNITTAVIFVVNASCSLVMLSKLMSTWFIEFLVVLICIGGMEGPCFKWFEHCYG
jgi:hypothetical protein